MGFAPLPQLHLEGYRPTTFDYDPPSSDGADGEVASPRMPGKEAWIEVFRKSIPEFKRRAASDPRVAGAAELAERFASDFSAGLDLVLAGDHASLFEGEPTVLKLCAMRDECLRQLGFRDCFLDVKTRENDQALTVLPSVLDEIDAIADPRARVLELVRGAFAGNIFDLGAATSAALYADGGVSFHATRDALKPRPWCVDDFDALAERWIPTSSDTDVAGSIPSPGASASCSSTTAARTSSSAWSRRSRTREGRMRGDPRRE